MEAFEFIMNDTKLEQLLEKVSNQKQKLMLKVQHLENYEINLSKHISERIDKA